MLLAIKGLLIPFLGTSLGSAFVFLMKNELNPAIQRILSGFAAGVMVSASVWSLIIPAIEQSTEWGRFSAIPAISGFCLGVIFLMLLDKAVAQTSKLQLSKTSIMVIAVVLHNIPEGMAVGVIYASLMSGNTGIAETAALALATGIAIQNIPEGAIISMPLKGDGVSKFKAFNFGVASGIVEPIAGFFTILLSKFVVTLMPYLLGFAAGAMMYVVVAELVPEMNGSTESKSSVLMFTAGFSLMLFLDVAFG